MGRLEKKVLYSYYELKSKIADDLVYLESLNNLFIFTPRQKTEALIESRKRLEEILNSNAERSEGLSDLFSIDIIDFEITLNLYTAQDYLVLFKFLSKNSEFYNSYENYVFYLLIKQSLLDSYQDLENIANNILNGDLKIIEEKE